MTYADAVDDGIEGDVEEFDRDSKPWLEILREAEHEFSKYQSVADKIDREYGELERNSRGDDAEFNILWANLEVVKPTIYARVPQPVVTARFRDRKPLPRAAANLLERALISDIEADDLHSTLKLVRDDLATVARGVAWLSLQEVDGVPRVVCEHVCRADFRHDPARKWSEVEWVARRAFLTRKRMKARFESVGDAWSSVQYSERHRSSEDDSDRDQPKRRKTAEVWEIWHKTDNVVVWVSPGCKEVLDIRRPFLTLEEFWPCPRPAFATMQRDSLVPIPEMVYYRGQINRVNVLTARISALIDNLRVRGLIPAGSGDVREAIEQALAIEDDGKVLIPVPNLAQFSAGGGRLVEWMPIDQVIVVLREAQQLRTQLIEDIYQITGISDIMRGESEASETATAQNIKAQYGSVRIRTRQEEMVRFARDVIRMKAEIMAEQFEGQTLLEMSQVDDLPAAEEVERRLEQPLMILQQAAQMQSMAQQNPAVALQMQQDPRMMQMAQQVPALQKQVQEIREIVTIDDVMALLRSQRLRPFVLDIETDSTIQPDENAEKQRRTEYVQVVGGMAQQALPAVIQYPKMAPVIVEILRFASGAFRAGRDLEGVLDEFAEDVREMTAQAAQASAKPSPDQLKTQAEVEKLKAETQRILAEAGGDQSGSGGEQSPSEIVDMKMRAKEMQLDRQQAERRLQADVILGREKIMAGLAEKRMELAAKMAAGGNGAT